MFMGQYLKGINMAQIKTHNGACYAHAQTSIAYNRHFRSIFCDNRRVLKCIPIYAPLNCDFHAGSIIF